MTMDYKDECKDRWLCDNSYKSQLGIHTIIPLRPNFGCYITVGSIDISEDMFKEEYDVISNAYFSVIQKMNEHYKNKSNILS